MSMVKVISIILFSLLYVSEIRGFPKVSISYNGDKNAMSDMERRRQWQDNTQYHNIQIRSTFDPITDILKKPSALLGKLKSHLGFGHKPGCLENGHHRYEDLPPRDFNHNRHNFEESERFHKHHDFHHGSAEFHNHGGRWNNFPHEGRFPEHKFDTYDPKYKPNYHTEKPDHHLSSDDASRDTDKKVSRDYISSTSPSIDIRFGDA